MPNQEASSYPSDERIPINPYEVSSLGDSAFKPAPSIRSSTPRSFRVCMDWSDRQRFLRAVGPLRVAALTGGLLGLLGLIGLLGVSIERWRYGWPVASVFMSGALSCVSRVLILYMLWSYWKLATELAVTAGGTKSAMREWSELQLRIAWLLLLWIAMDVATWAAEWTKSVFSSLSAL